MDIRKYEVFLRAVECGNLTRAGEELGYTQSGVSHMMKSLENELGFPLLIRGRTGVVPTPEGEEIHRIARELVKWNQLLNQSVAAIRGLETGEIRIGTFFSVSINWLPQIIKRFQQAHPHITIHLMEGGVCEMEDWLTEGRVDLAFLSRQEHHRFDWIPLKEDRMLAVLPLEEKALLREAGLCSHQPIPLSYFEDKPFILSAEGFDYDVHRVLREGQVSPRIEFSSMDDYAIVSMVKNGLGLSILPELALKDQMGAILATELNPPFYRSLGIALPCIKNASPAASKFIKCVKTFGSELFDSPSAVL